jgi:hypothetical protein
MKIGRKSWHISSHRDQSDIPKRLSFFDIAYVLLRLDQFPSGVWGTSLEKTAALFGHKHDPGSISVSTDASIAICYFTASRASEPVKRYQQYLFKRQSPSGAFGMLRQLGTEKFPRYKVLQHGRHTATALKFLLHCHDSNLQEAERAMSFLINHRTPSGWWVDIGSLRDHNADPLTVAFVVDALECSRKYPWKAVSAQEIDRMIITGLDYLFNCKWRVEEGWIYKISSSRDRDLILSNTYVYTGDVLSSSAASCLRLKRHLPELKNAISSLLKVANTNGGIGSAKMDQSLNLDPTMTLLEAAVQFSAFRPAAIRIFRHIVKAYRQSGIMNRSTANGWASFLFLGHQCGYFSTMKKDRVAKLENLIHQLINSDVGSALPKALSPVELLVQRILSAHNSNRKESLVAT